MVRFTNSDKHEIPWESAENEEPDITRWIHIIQTSTDRCDA
jgi:hypothetical protein